MEKSKLSLRKWTFFPPFAVLLIFLVVSMISQEVFLDMINTINNWIIANLGWVASLLALFITGITMLAMFSKFGEVASAVRTPSPS